VTAGPGALAGRHVVITGGNSGIGLEAAVGLAQLGAHIVIAVRNTGKGERAVNEIRDRAGTAAVEQMPIDLASLASIRAFAEAWRARGEPLHVLLNNAGLLLRSRTTTADGFETTFGVNHLGHFLLTALLRDALVASAPARVATVSSGAHNGARRGLAFDDLMWERRRYSGMGMGAYCASKLANVMFTRELARRLVGTGVTANALHPGFVASNFAREGDGGRLGDIGMRLLRPFALSPAKGARTSIHVASAPELEGVSGEYFYKCAPAKVSAHALDDGACARLWQVSEQLVGLT
jgi:NAD(P)-dependent dehydrogenase (short-subunit alcohol dehydrogenase family)